MTISLENKFKKISVQIKNPHARELGMSIKSLSLSTDMFTQNELYEYIIQLIKGLEKAEEVTIKRWQKIKN